jgi:hypothetical protein
LSLLSLDLTAVHIYNVRDRKTIAKVG